MSLPSRWRFDPGAEVAINFQLDEGTPGLCPPTLRTTGVVVDCEPDARRAGVFWLTLLFLESTDDVLTLVQALADYRARLAAAGANKTSKSQALDEIAEWKVNGPPVDL